MSDISVLKTAARNIRRNILLRANAAGANGAHIAPSLSLAEILSVLFLDVMKYDKSNRQWSGRDRFILSKGHGGLGCYAAMFEAGVINEDEFLSFETNGGDYPGQPSKNTEAAIEYSGGTLGMGLSYGIGLAMSKECKQNNCNIYVLLGDGELNEGMVWESAMFAGQQHIENITAIIDRNSMQSDGFTKDIINFDILAMWKACGWMAAECDGHDVAALEKTFNLRKSGCPQVIIADTVKGKGVSFMENAREWHHGVLSQKQLELALAELDKGQ